MSKLKERDGGITNKRLEKLVGQMLGPGSSKYDEIDTEYLEYCRAFGIEPSKHATLRRYFIFDENRGLEPGSPGARASLVTNRGPATLIDPAAANGKVMSRASEGWTDGDNDLIVADYFDMLTDELAGRPYNKTAHRRGLSRLLDGKSNGSIEFKHQNISAVLERLGLPWIEGYKPRHNFQGSLVEAVERRLAIIPPEMPSTDRWADPGGQPRHPASLIFVDPPGAVERPNREAEEKIAATIRKLDYAARDERNRELGRAGEKLVLENEISSLRDAGRHDLANRVRWVSDTDGDGAGYDIASFYPDGREKFIEVKTTNGGERSPFYVSSNELAASREKPGAWCLVRVWDFSREPRAFELRPPLEERVDLAATVYRASFG